MATCKECLHFEVCSPYTAPNESYPEVGGCYAFKDCAEALKTDALNLIVDMQAEVNRLEKSNLKEAMIFNAETIKAAVTEELLLFLNALKERAYVARNEWSHGEHPKVVEWDDILDEFEQRFGETK